MTCHPKADEHGRVYGFVCDRVGPDTEALVRELLRALQPPPPHDLPTPLLRSAGGLVSPAAAPTWKKP